VQSVSSTVAALPAGSKVSVIGITNDSFATPYIILSAELAADEGYFKERLAKGHASLLHAWQSRSAQLAPRYADTDILGALLVASEVFHESPDARRKVLIVLSDMKQATRALNLEHQSTVQMTAAMQQVANNKMLADLQGVEVYAEGVDAASGSVGYWQSLHDFWVTYFARAGATVKGYSVLRDVPDFDHSLPIAADGHGR
jgi:hypothetical protein